MLSFLKYKFHKSQHFNIHFCNRDRNGNQKSFENYVMITVRSQYKEGLILTRYDTREVFIGRDLNWQKLPGNQNDVEGLIYKLPVGQGK